MSDEYKGCKLQLAKELRGIADELDGMAAAGVHDPWSGTATKIRKNDNITKPETGDAVVDFKLVGVTLLIDIGDRPHCRIGELQELLRKDHNQ